MAWKTYLLLRCRDYPKGSRSTIPIKILSFLQQWKSTFSNMELKVAPNSQTIWKKNTVEGFTLPHFKTHHKATETKVVWYQHNYRDVDQGQK